jgi:hypothetical protein
MASKVRKLKVRTTAKKPDAQRHLKAAVVSDAPSFAAGGKKYVVVSGEGALVSARTLQDRQA